MTQFPKADKKLGQHFLKDQAVIRDITNDFAAEAKDIIEVGPGPGVLTSPLAELEKNLHVIEKDARFIPSLSQLTTEVYHDDALDFSWEELFSKIGHSDIWLVSNLPYNVGTPLFIKFLAFAPIKFMTLMFQKEVGEKTIARAKKNSMNGLEILTSIYFEGKLLRKVPPGCFSPPPKVDSIVISYRRKESPQFSLEEFYKIDRWCRVIFSQKRKQLGSVLKKHLTPDQFQMIKETFSEILPSRAEALTREQVYDLLRNFLQL